MDKVEYAVDAASTFPRHYTGEVVVTLDDGRTLRHRVAVNRGNPDRPLTNAEIEAKYFENCALTLDEGAARRDPRRGAGSRVDRGRQGIRGL